MTLQGSRHLSAAFRQIRNYLAGRARGITRDRDLLAETLKALFCYVFEKPTLLDLPDDALRTYEEAFDRVKQRVCEVFEPGERLKLDSESVLFLHQVFEQVDLLDEHVDPAAELYQAFIGNEARGAEGQFFTPVEAVSWLVDAVVPRAGEKIIDPACGAGTFLSYAVRKALKAKADQGPVVCGVEKDEFLAKLARAHVALYLGTSPDICSGDSLAGKLTNGDPLPFSMDGAFDVVVANPPFGAKIHAGSPEVVSSYELGQKWKYDQDSGHYVNTGQAAARATPQILFVERCIRLLKPGGRLGLVVPESMLTSASTLHVSQYILNSLKVSAVVGMPESLFKTSGKGGTHTKTCLLVGTKQVKPSTRSKIFMAEARWCGHDSRGNPIPKNDLPEIARLYRAHLSNKMKTAADSHGYIVPRSKVKSYILAPRYYDPGPRATFEALADTHDLVCLGDMISSGALQLATGDEVGKLAYGTGPVPFVRSSDLSNWEIKLDAKHGLSEKVYQEYRDRQDVQEGDILMVRDGTYLIGTCAYVSKYDRRIVYQSHIYKLRLADDAPVSAYLFLAAISSAAVRRQIGSLRFTQDIIDSIGKRINEIILPIPKDRRRRQDIEAMVRRSINDRIEARELARTATVQIASTA